MFSKFIFLCCMLSVKAAPHVYDQSQNGELNVQVDLKDLQIFALLSGKHEEYYEDIDYAYDYSEMTIKPQTGTSKKPLNASNCESSTDNALVATTEPPKNTSLVASNLTSSADETTTVKSETAIATNTTSEIANIITETANITAEVVTTTSMLQSRKEDLVNQKEKEAEAISTKTTDPSDSVTQKPQSLTSKISSIKNETQGPSASTLSSVAAAASNMTTKAPASNNCKKGLVGNQRGGCDLKIQNMSNTLLKIVKLSQKLKSRRHRNGQDTI